MDVLKYFFEEPAALEALTADADPDARRRRSPSLPLEALLAPPRYCRGYLAGTDLATGRVGLTALAHPEAFIAPLLDVLAGRCWACLDTPGAYTTPDEAAVRGLLRDPADVAVLVCAAAPLPPEAVAAVVEGARRHALPALRRLLDRGAVALFPEPAHHGYDWSFFADRPLRAALVEAFRRRPHPGVRRFVLPFQKARAEHKFYFETWQLDALPDYVEEV